MSEAKHPLWVRIMFPLTIAAALVVMMADNGALAKWIALDAVPFVLFWTSAATIVVLARTSAATLVARATKGRFRASAAKVNGNVAKVVVFSAFLAAVAIVVVYSALVIAPVVTTPSGDQTGVGCIWLVASLFAIMIALPAMSTLLSPLWPDEPEEYLMGSEI